MEHSFTSIIQTTLEKHFKENADTIFSLNDLLKYINIKTRSAEKGSKSRGTTEKELSNGPKLGADCCRRNDEGRRIH